MQRFEIYLVTDPETKEYEQFDVAGRSADHALAVWASLVEVDEVTRVTVKGPDEISCHWVWPSLFWQIADEVEL